MGKLVENDSEVGSWWQKQNCLDCQVQMISDSLIHLSSLAGKCRLTSCRNSVYPPSFVAGTFCVSRRNLAGQRFLVNQDLTSLNHRLSTDTKNR
jgi:hypothetical protein